MKKTIILITMVLGTIVGNSQTIADRLLASPNRDNFDAVRTPTSIVWVDQDTIEITGKFDRFIVAPINKLQISSTSNVIGLDTKLTNITSSVSTLQSSVTTLAASIPGANTTHTVTRSLNTNYTVTTTKESYVDYTIDIQTTVNLLGGTQASTVFLEWTTNGGTTWNLEDQARNSQVLTVAIAVGLVQITSCKVTGFIPSGARTRLRTSGTGTVTYLYGKERY